MKHANVDFEIEQYRQAIEYERHLTRLNWEIAAILLAGVLAGLALTLPKSSTEPFGPSTLVVSLLGIVAVLTWLLLVGRNRDLSFVVVARARGIEDNPGGLMTKLHESWEHGSVQLGGKTYTLQWPHGFTTVKLMVTVLLIVLFAVVVLSLQALLKCNS